MKKTVLKVSSLLIILLLLLSACSKSLYIDRHELSLRLKDGDPAHFFDPQTAIIKNKKQYVFLSLQEEDDCLLTLHVDEVGSIKSFSLTLDSKDFGKDEIKDILLPLFNNILIAFLQDENIAQKAIKSLKFDKIKSFKKGIYEKAEVGKYNFSFFANELSLVFECGHI